MGKDLLLLESFAFVKICRCKLQVQIALNEYITNKIQVYQLKFSLTYNLN